MTGMTCGGCENAVRRAVGQLKGVTEVTASHARERVEVSFNPAVVDLAAIKKKVAALGYSVAD